MTPVGMKVTDLVREFDTLRSVGRLLLRPGRPTRYLAEGETVMTLPGFAFGDASMFRVRSELRSVGFKAMGWNLGINRGDVRARLPKIMDRVKLLADRAGQPISLVGWSLGGYLAREVGREMPDQIEHIVTLASPIRGGPKYTVVGSYYRRRGFNLDDIEAAIARREAVPLTVPVTCVYSKRDGVVDWRAVIDHNNPRATNIQVNCSHLAMGLDPTVLAVTTRQLLGSRTAQGFDRDTTAHTTSHMPTKGAA